MYISCGSTDSTALETETGYVPNNPLFGMPLDSPQECPSSCGGSGCSNCQENAASLPLAGLHGSDFSDCGNCLDHSGVLSSQSALGSYWNEDMSTFPGLPPLDIDPLPSLFPFSPCGASYNRPERPTHDVADVLLSLKHAVLKQSPDPQPIGQSAPTSYPTPQASLSYTVHPQMLLSPPAGHHGGHNSHSHYNQMQSQPGSYATNYYDSSCAQHSTPIYPSMSVNVSMNMTMHGYGADASVPMQCSQMQWGTQNAASSVNVLYPPMLSPSGNLNRHMRVHGNNGQALIT
uniref:Uncharacterized protein n=1 Tax=Anopheles albimanus TaxID=7167 RepID=A0A182F8G4_ANOAL